MDMNKIGLLTLFLLMLTTMAIFLLPLGSATDEGTPKRVFVTNGTFFPNFGGLAGGDAICNTSATNANLNGTWVAWLSTGPSNVSNATVVNARRRIPDAPYVRIDGAAVANNKPDLTDGSIINPINISEFGTPISTPVLIPGVYTGTNESGMATHVDCAAWTTTNYSATIGSQAHTDALWTDASDRVCSIKRRLYCFEK